MLSQFMPTVARNRLSELFVRLASCSTEASAYGRCVSRNAEKISKGVCEAEFLELLRCVSRAVEKMKIRRLKKARRVLSFLRNNFALGKPYTVLLDGTFCQCALENKINIREQLATFLQCEDVKLCTTNCVLEELRLLGGHFRGALLIARSFNVLRCRHKAKHGKPATAAECLQTTVGEQNVRRYILATQDKQLRQTLKDSIDAFASLLIHHRSIIFDHLGDRCKAAAMQQVDSKIQQQCTLHGIDMQATGEEKAAPKIQRRRRVAMGPNPLSCKKKKPRPEQANAKRAGRKRRRQRHSTK